MSSNVLYHFAKRGEGGGRWTLQAVGLCADTNYVSVCHAEKLPGHKQPQNEPGGFRGGELSCPPRPVGVGVCVCVCVVGGVCVGGWCAVHGEVEVCVWGCVCVCVCVCVWGSEVAEGGGVCVCVCMCVCVCVCV